MKYLLLATLSAIALGQATDSGDPNSNALDRWSALAARANRFTSATASESRGDDAKNGNGSPVLLQQVSRRPVLWTKAPAVCSLLKTEVTGSGQGRTTITLARNPDGTF